ncbi:MAG: CoA-binding protein [Deltaproteobacteria bacterium]|nr:MAG: CoA-binding protein [Deltaproteobacteria bacterium]
MKTIDEKIAAFLAAPAFGVAGASKNPDKYGNKVLRCYQMNGRKAVPVNPVETEIEGMACVRTVGDLPPEVESLSIITPPQVTDKVVELAIAKGIKHIWMQPGAQSAAAIAAAEAAGIDVIADGSCLLVVLGYREH